MKLAGLGLCFSCVLLLSGCGNSATTNNPSTAQGQHQPLSSTGAKIKIVAAENFYGEVAQKVGGDRVEVVSILNNPATDPHEYEPTPDAARSVNDAQLIVSNGVGYDAWMDKLVSSASSASSKSVIKVANDVSGKKEGDNEHVWYDPSIMPKLANKIADDLAKIDPGSDQMYHQNAQAFAASLDPLTQQVQKLKQASPTLIDVSEPVFDYMAAALNLTIGDPKFEKAIDNSTDPSPADLGQLQSDIKDKKIKFFVFNSQNSSPTVNNVVTQAQAAGLPVVQVTETEPQGKNYLQWMTDQLNQVGQALGIK
ncbi:MAG: Periplasmic solute binding protein [Bacilli bacterium]|nr:Periplasmic solute binding protein [Bacilli bacterium]